MNSQMILTIVVFVAVYAAITTEVFNKTASALFGAMLMVILGVMSQEDAFKFVDLNVIFLLIGMMILTGITKRTGLFQFIAIKLAKLAKGEPVAILLLLALATAVISAFLDNVTTVLILVPITFLIAVELDVRPEPFVIVLAMASNVGGTATLIGDPPNIMIGSAAGLGFTDFLFKLGPVILAILAALCAFVWLVFRKDLRVSAERRARIMAFEEGKAITDKPLLAKSLLVLGLVVAGFLLHDIIGIQASTMALAGAALLLAVSGIGEVEEIFAEIEWSTIMFFIGLFMLVGALVHVGIMQKLSSLLLGATAGHAKATTMVVLWSSGILSAFVDNIPFVATMIPLIQDMGANLGHKAIEPLWWALSLGACLGGNGTLIGASANVISAGISGKNGHPISFAYFTKFGAAFAAISLLISSAYLLFAY